MSSNYNIQECRRIFGVMVCRFKNGFVATFPATKVDVNVFTTKNCAFCKPVVNQIKKMSKPLKDIVNVNIIPLDDSWQHYPDIKGAPTIQIGSQKFEGVPDQGQIFTAIFNNIDRGGTPGAAAATVGVL